MRTNLLRLAAMAFALVVLTSISVSGHPKGGFSIPDPRDVGDLRDVVDDLADIDYIINNLPGFGLSMDQEEPITTNFDDAVYDAPFLDGYPHAPIMENLWYMPVGNIPMGTGGGNFVMPGRYDYTIQSFCLHAGTYGPGHGEGYLWAPLRGPWAHIIRDLLKTSESHPEISQTEVQTLIWAILARTRISDMNPDMQRAARTLLTDDYIGVINGGAYGVIPQEMMGEVFQYVDAPPLVEQAMRSQADIRSLLTCGVVDYGELESVAVLAGNPPPGGIDRDIPAGRWSLHPAGYFVRYEPHGYSSNDVNIVVPDDCLVTYDSTGKISSIQDEHGNRIETSGNAMTFTRPDPMDYQSNLSETFSGLNIGSVENSSWARDHSVEVERLCGPGFQEIVTIGYFAHAISLATSDGSRGEMEARALDLAQEAWMDAVISVNMMKIPDGQVARSKDLPEWNWRDNWRESDDSGGSATPADRGRQRLAGRRDPRPSEDPDWGEAPDDMPEYDPDKNPPANNAREGMNNFNNAADTLSWIQSGPSNVVNMVGFAVPNAVFGGMLEFAVTLWDYCTAAIASDPPRRDYNVIASPQHFAFAPLIAPQDGSETRVNALNALMADGLTLTGFLIAAVESIDRQGGARIDGDQYWAYEQAKAALYFERQAGYQMYHVADRLDEYIAVLRAEGITDIYTTPESCQDRIDRLRSDGWSSEQLAAARELGIHQNLLDTYMEFRLSRDPDEIAGSVFEAAEELSSALRGCGNWLIDLPDVCQEDFPGNGSWVSVGP